jgi:hypothetical protein
MLTGEIRNQIDRIWDAFWSGGIANPQTPSPSGRFHRALLEAGVWLPLSQFEAARQALS